jgi:nucleotide-binding universal stress UspA family protein
MFRRILVATDGTPAAAAAVDAAIGFAHLSGARVVGLHVAAPWSRPSEGTGVAALPKSDEAAKECLGHVERRAQQAQVSAEVLTRRADAPSEAILAVARELQCDLIVMGTHAGRGVGARLPGSQTTAVLTHSAIPVLVVPSSRPPVA